MFVSMHARLTKWISYARVGVTRALVRTRERRYRVSVCELCRVSDFSLACLVLLLFSLGRLGSCGYLRTRARVRGILCRRDDMMRVCAMWRNPQVFRRGRLIGRSSQTEQGSQIMQLLSSIEHRESPKP